MNETDARSRILAEATRLFGRKGYGATAVREVCEAAGVTKPALYYWFDGKEALFLEAVRIQVERLCAIVREAVDQGGTMPQRLERFVEHYLRSALADEDGVRLMMNVTHPVDDGQPVVDLMSVHRENILRIAGVLATAQERGDVRDDVDAAVAAIGLMGSANLHIVAGLHGMPLPTDIHVRIVKNFLFGVTPR